jgi:hypothetical protein
MTFESQWPILEMKARAALREQGKGEAAVEAITSAIKRRISDMPLEMKLCVPREAWEQVAGDVMENIDELRDYFLTAILDLEAELYEARAPFGSLQ